MDSSLSRVGAHLRFEADLGTAYGQTRRN